MGNIRFLNVIIQAIRNSTGASRHLSESYPDAKLSAPALQIKALLVGLDDIDEGLQDHPLGALFLLLDEMDHLAMNPSEDTIGATFGGSRQHK